MGTLEETVDTVGGTKLRRRTDGIDAWKEDIRTRREKLIVCVAEEGVEGDVVYE